MRQTRFVCLATVACAMGLPITGFAQTSSIEGIVREVESRDPIVDVVVTVDGTELLATTNVNGFYQIDSVPVGTHSLRIRATGFQPLSPKNIVVAAGLPTAVNFQLQRSIFRIDGVVVTGVANEIETAKLTFTVDKISAEDLPVVPLIAIGSLEGRVAGASVVNTSGLPGVAPGVLLRGVTSLNTAGRSNEPLYVVDGVTPDRRIAGDSTDGTAIGLDFRYDPSIFQASRGNYHQSSYVHYRYEHHGLDNKGPVTLVSSAAQQILKAEGLYRLGQSALAATVVNVTRVGRGGLPPASGSDPDLLEKIFYEYLIENFNVCAGCAHFSRRGWAELADTRGSPIGTHHWGPVEGTPLHFAMPGVQLEVLGQRYYTYGGVGNEGTGLLGTSPSQAAVRAAAVFHTPLFLMSTLREKVVYLQDQRRTRGRRGAKGSALVPYR